MFLEKIDRKVKIVDIPNNENIVVFTSMFEALDLLFCLYFLFRSNYGGNFWMS